MAKPSRCKSDWVPSTVSRKRVEKHLGLRVFVGKRSASTSTSRLLRESLNQLVAETCTLAKAVVEDQVVRACRRRIRWRERSWIWISLTPPD